MLDDLQRKAEAATEVRERPILFQGAMVRATLADTKTQTRRMVKGLALDWLGEAGFTPEFLADKGNHLCPYGNPGDRLWVRESWRAMAKWDHLPPRLINPTSLIWYEADGAPDEPHHWGKRRPPMFMPRWACRLQLEITDIRVERLQDISAMDALQEGLEECHDLPYRWEHAVCLQTAQRLYRELWEQINEPGSWDLNPFVWVVAFRRIQP